MPDVVISDEERVSEIREQLISWWIEKLHVVADFDRTLTKAFNGKQHRWSLISVLYEDGYLSEEYQKTAQGYFDHYHPIEVDPNIPFEEKKQAMEEWWVKHKQLLIAEWLTKEHIYDAMETQNVQLRDGFEEFFAFLNSNTIPLVILSAGGLGTISIEKYLENNAVLTDNIHILGNEFIWNEEWVAIDFKQPVIHSYNKDETVIQSFSEVYTEVKERKNVILLGDSPEDVKMIHGFEYDVLLKIWFLNKDVDNNMDLYKERYDVVIAHDGSLEYVNGLLEDVV